MIRRLILMTAVMCACSSIKISDVKKADDFFIKNYKTFNFFNVDVSGDAIRPNYQDNLKLLKEAITKQMGLKGITPSVDNPDLLVNIGVVITEEVQTRQSSISDPGARSSVAYMSYRGYSWKSETVEISRYREGTVTLDFVDRASNTLVWQGSAESILPQKDKNTPPLIEEGMQKLFTKLQ